MKLSNLSVIFIVIAIPVILILSYYISLQRDTINLQTAYNTKLLESTKEAIEAFEINTVEWNEAYSETADSKRRDIMASINTFTTSLANNLGVSGTSKEYLLANIPAIAFTLYDGCYIYSPSETKYTVKNEKGVAVFMSNELCNKEYAPGEKHIQGYSYNPGDEGKILYLRDTSTYPFGASSTDGTYRYIDSDGNLVSQDFTLDPIRALKTNATDSQDYPHILKPFTAYSESVTNTNGRKMIINYTLDNYVTIYGQEDSSSEYIAKSGYLNKISSSSPENGDNVIHIPTTSFTGKLIEGIKFSGQEVNPEKLSETIAYKDGGGNVTTKTYNYVYESKKNTKVYYDDSIGEYFTLNKNLEKVYVRDLTEPLYKKCSVPVGSVSDPDFVRVYQSLVKNPAGGYTWYVKNDTTEEYFSKDISTWGALGASSTDPEWDYSAINYCVETYVFTHWVNSLDIIEKIKEGNDPEDEYSKFGTHKREVIKNTIVSNLNQAITSYSKQTDKKYRLPKLQETEWDQVLSNISIITFLQNIPIGLKDYNNYAIATSTFNKEFVDPNELYIYDIASPETYHLPYCSKLNSSGNLIGYRNIDYIYKNYQGMTEDDIKYYFKHENTTDEATQSCYYCLVQRELYEENKTNTKIDAYYTTLARERYLQLDEPKLGEEKTEIVIGKTVDKTTKKYGEAITYKITVTNNSTNDKTIEIQDKFDKAVNSFMNVTGTTEGTLSVVGDTIIVSGIHLAVGETKTIQITGTVIGGVGKYSNTAKVAIDGQEFESSKVTVTIVKDVRIVASSMNPINVVFIIDSSASMVGPRIQAAQTAVKEFVDRMPNDGKSQIGFAKFYTLGLWFIGGPYANTKGPYNISNREQFKSDLDFGADANLLGATPFATGLKRGRELLQNMQSSAPDNMDVAIFLSDGVNFYIEVPHYTTRADELQAVADRVYAIGYKAELATNFDTLRDDIASSPEYFRESTNLSDAFNDIFNNLAETTNQSIDGSVMLEEMANIHGAGNMIGNWISLSNSSEYNFNIGDDGSMQGINISSTPISIQVAGTEKARGTLVELSNQGYIGKAGGKIYLNLDGLGSPSDPITIEVIK